MSKLIAFRCPDDLFGLILRKGTTTEVVIDALRKYLAPSPLLASTPGPTTVPTFIPLPATPSSVPVPMAVPKMSTTVLKTSTPVSVPPIRPRHDPNCRCLLCRPPK